jgi:hypothetical protein
MANRKSTINTNDPRLKQETDIQLLALASAGVSQEVQNSIQEKGYQLAIVEDKFREGIRKIQSDALLSDIGKNQKIQALGEELTRKVDEIQREVNQGLDGHIGQLEKKRVPPPMPGDATLNYLREREYRDILRGVDASIVTLKYQQACASGTDPFLERAVENCPSGFPLISDPRVIEAGREVRLERQTPEISKQLNDLRSMKACVIHLFETAKREVDTP